MLLDCYCRWTQENVVAKFIFSVQLLWVGIQNPTHEVASVYCQVAPLSDLIINVVDTDADNWRHISPLANPVIHLWSPAPSMVDCNVNLHGQAHAVRKKRGVLVSAQTLKSSVWLWHLYHTDTKTCGCRFIVGVVVFYCLLFINILLLCCPQLLLLYILVLV